MFTCFIRYVIDLSKLDTFETYARSWMTLVEKYGGTHHGYFLPTKDTGNLPEATFSFPNISKEGPDNIAIALFSFPDLEAYEIYKRDVVKDKLCKKTTAQFNETKCFLSYERSFLKPIFK